MLEVFKIYKPKHKIIYNTSGFENLQTFKKLCKYIDILLTDFKYFDDNLAIKYSNAPNYRSVTIKVIKEYDKYKQTKVKDGILLEGRIIRHLVLPSLITDSFKVLDEIAKLGKNHIVSIMSQFTALQNSLLNRKITALEYKAVIAHARKLGLNFGYLQDFESADEIFIPKF